jgi:carboxymethylenebutenolidase
MTTTIELTGADGVAIGAYRADPPGRPRGGVVVLQEIFGVNAHIRRVADGFAAAGYLAIAPALFDRAAPGTELGYTPADIPKGRDLVAAVGHENTMRDVAAAVAFAAVAGEVGVVGYCWGGSLAFAAACTIPGVAAAVGYYGGTIARSLDQRPKAPLMLHFGERDDHIPMADVAAVRAALAGVPVHTYPAGHGFNCDDRGSYDQASAAAARERTLAFLAEHVG